MATNGSDGELWVFGYGSLMWRPDFRYVERHLADLHGYRRRFCIRSVHYRGTEEAPGLVLGLDYDAGAACRGVAFRVAAEDAEETLAILRKREMISGVYLEVTRPVHFTDDPAKGHSATAVTYVVDRDNRQYAGELPIETQAEIISRAVGDIGPNCVYLHNTVEHLNEMGVRDRELEELDALVRARDCRGAAAG